MWLSGMDSNSGSRLQEAIRLHLIHRLPKAGYGTCDLGRILIAARPNRGGQQGKQALSLPERRGMSVLMKNSQKKVLPFPKPSEEPGASTIIVQIGDERFAIYWEIEDRPPATPLVLCKRGSKEPLRRS